MRVYDGMNEGIGFGIAMALIERVSDRALVDAGGVRLFQLVFITHGPLL